MGGVFTNTVIAMTEQLHFTSRSSAYAHLKSKEDDPGNWADWVVNPLQLFLGEFPAVKENLFIYCIAMELIFGLSIFKNILHCP